MKAKGTFFLGNQTFETREFDLPPVGPHDALIRNKVCGICGTDVHIYHGGKGSTDVTPPVILGHEYSGVVVEVGSAVTNIAPGDHVTIDPNMYCGTCRHCRAGRKQMCESMQAVGVNQDGGFAEYSVVPASQCLTVSPELDFESAAMSEPLACCIHGIDRANIRPGSNVCVIGGGPIGLLMVQLAKLSGAAQVVLSEPVAMRREIGLSLGADHAVDPIAAPLSQQLQEILGAEGADVVIECVGKTIATAQAFEAAGKGATILLFSVPDPDAVYGMQLYDAFKKELTVVTSFVNPDTQSRAVALLNSGAVKVAPLISHRYPLEKLEEAIHKQMANDSIKVVVTAE